MKLHVLSFALAFGLLWGAGLFLLTWWIMLNGTADSGPAWIGSVYLGYSLTPLGSIIGLLWALGDGFVGGAIFAWLYNVLVGALADQQPAQQTAQSQ